MSRRARRGLRELWILFLAFVALQSWQAASLSHGPLPRITGQLADGRIASAHEFLAGGRPLLLYVWQENCAICRAEEGTLRALARDWPLLGLALQSGDAAAVADYMRSRQLDYPTLIDAEGALARSLGVRATPTWFVIDRNGAIRFAGLGYTTGWGLRARLWLAQWPVSLAGP